MGKNSSLTPIILLVIIFISALTFDAEILANEWRIIGPGGGGGIELIAVNPHNNNHVFAKCDMTGGYRSFDGGQTWNMFNLWTLINDFSFSKKDPDVVYASTHGYLHGDDRGGGLSVLFKSQNKGNTWSVIYPNIGDMDKISKFQSSKLLPSKVIPGAFNGSIKKIWLDPQKQGRIFLGMESLAPYIASIDDKKSKKLFIIFSDDDGNTWKKLLDVPGHQWFEILTIPSSDKIIIVTDAASIHYDLSSRSKHRFPLPSEEIILVKGGMNKEISIMYALAPVKRTDKGIKGGLYRSFDWGITWQSIELKALSSHLKKNNSTLHLLSLSLCYNQPQILYLSVARYQKKIIGSNKSVYEIYKSELAGNDATAVWQNSSDGPVSDNYEEGWLEQSYKSGWFGSPIHLSVSPTDPDICYATDNGRVFATMDGGKTWKQRYTKRLPNGSFVSSGLDVTTSYNVKFDPFDSRHMFINYTDIGLFHSKDGGKSWNHSIKGIPISWRNTCYDLEFDSKIKGRIWSAWGRIHDLPREKMFRTRWGFDWAPGGVALSNDGGNTWEKQNKGLPSNAICTSLSLAPSTATSDRILYTTVFGKGVYKSEDGGKKWSDFSQGLGENRFVWQIRHGKKGKLYLVVVKGIKSGESIEGNLYFRGGESDTWTLLALPSGVKAPVDLQIDLMNPERMYLSCWPDNINGNDRYGGLWISEDGGIKWRQVFDESLRVNASSINPFDVNKLYLVTFNNSAYLSNDRGKNWHIIHGYRFKWGQRIIPDPYYPDNIYIATYGGSVFHGFLKEIPGKEVKNNYMENLIGAW